MILVFVILYEKISLQVGLWCHVGSLKIFLWKFYCLIILVYMILVRTDLIINMILNWILALYHRYLHFLSINWLWILYRFQFANINQDLLAWLNNKLIWILILIFLCEIFKCLTNWLFLFSQTMNWLLSLFYFLIFDIDIFILFISQVLFDWTYLCQVSKIGIFVFAHLQVCLL